MATFEPEKYLIKLPRWEKDEKGKMVRVEDDYLEVKHRIRWFRDRYPQGTIGTEELCVDLDREVTVEKSRWNSGRKEFYTVTGKGYARIRATVCTGEGGLATGTKSETAADFPDFVEKAETGAIGRALAALGFGTQFTGDELDEGARMVDAPVEEPKGAEPKTAQKPEEPPKRIPAPVANESEETAPASKQQVSSIHKLCELLGKPLPEKLDTLTFAQARQVIGPLTEEYKAARQHKRAS